MIEHDITYKWVYALSTVALSATRKILGAVEGQADVQLATGSYRSPTSFALNISKAQSIYLICDQAVTLHSNGTNAVQTVSISGSPTGGTFPLTVPAVSLTTAGIGYAATASQVASALNALAGVQVTAAGGPLPGTPVVVTFAGALGLQPLSTMTTSSGSLTGGSSPTASVASTVTGVNPDTTINLLAGVPLVWDSAAYFAMPFAANIGTLSVTNLSGVTCNLSLRTLSTS
jgi:hypothetical protein